VVQCHSLSLDLRLNFGCACVLNQPLHITLVDLLLDHGDVVQEELLQIVGLLWWRLRVDLVVLTLNELLSEFFLLAH